MSLKVKYQYTHFIYPFVVEERNYISFINSILNNKDWNLKVHNYNDDKESYDFFLPYMRKFLFPTLFWDKLAEKNYKMMSEIKKALAISKLSCVTFEYKLDNIKNGSISNNRSYGAIQFDISNITLICFKSGICFFNIKTQIEDKEEFIDFDKILDFNYSFRNLSPRSNLNNKKVSKIKAKKIDKIENISIFIKSIISGFETDDIEKIYYDKMFTYSYVCVDSWENKNDIEKMKNDFFKFQYVMDSKSTALFNNDCKKLNENIYSRWEYSLFGFSIESGVVFVSDKEKYNITRMPYNFEKKYFYMLLLALYQRISLMNFSQELLKKDKTKIKSLNNRFTKFTHFSWFGQITNSEHGMDMWENWQNAFKLKELFEEVHKEYLEYSDYLRDNAESRLKIVLMLTYMVTIFFSGMSLLTQLFGLKGTWIEPIIVVMMILAILSYPGYLVLGWIKHKLEKRIY